VITKDYRKSRKVLNLGMVLEKETGKNSKKSSEFAVVSKVATNSHLKIIDEHIFT